MGFITLESAHGFPIGIRTEDITAIYWENGVVKVETMYNKKWDIANGIGVKDIIKLVNKNIEKPQIKRLDYQNQKLIEKLIRCHRFIEFQRKEIENGTSKINK